MADSISALSSPLVGQRTKTLAHLVTLRLITGYILLSISLIGLLGGNWDIQWHATIGRDRTFTPPHDMILIAIGLSGITALISILIETWWTGQHLELRQDSTDFLGILRSSLGSYFVGFAAVCSAIAFPLDTYWHTLYGIDVSLWAPFHTMLSMSGMLSTFGTTYILLSAAHLAQNQQRLWPACLSYAGVIIALAFLLSRLTTFLLPSVNLGLGGIGIFPFLLTLCVAFVCIFALRLIHWPGTATLLTLTFLLVYLLNNTFVPSMMQWLMQIEHQRFLPEAAGLRSLIVPLIAQSPWLLLTGLSVDGIILLGKRAHWSLSTWNWSIALTVALSTMIVAALILITLAAELTSGHTTGGSSHGSMLFLLSLALAIPAGLVGSWLGTTISQTVEELRR